MAPGVRFRFDRATLLGFAIGGGTPKLPDSEDEGPDSWPTATSPNTVERRPEELCYLFPDLEVQVGTACTSLPSRPGGDLDARADSGSDPSHCKNDVVLLKGVLHFTGSSAKAPSHEILSYFWADYERPFLDAHYHLVKDPILLAKGLTTRQYFLARVWSWRFFLLIMASCIATLIAVEHKRHPSHIQLTPDVPWLPTSRERRQKRMIEASFLMDERGSRKSK